MVALDHLLVPLDGSTFATHALPLASTLAGSAGHITLIRVVEKALAVRGRGGVEVVPANIANEWMLRDAHHYLHEIAREWRNVAHSGPTIDTVVATGDPAAAILRAIAEHHPDLIVMTSHGRGALGRAAFGSVADRLARTVDIPIVIVRPGNSEADKPEGVIRQIIVPLDGSERATTAVPVAKALALRTGSAIRLIHVIATLMPFQPATNLLVTPEMTEEWHDDARTAMEPIAATLRKDGIVVRIEVYEGSPYSILAASPSSGDLIVMTSHGDSGLSRWLLGSVAEKLVRMATAPVCLVPARHPD